MWRSASWAPAPATTLALVEIQGRTIRPYHVGDSVILLTGQRGKLKLQTIPHSPIGYAVEAGLMKEEDAIHHEARHVISNVIGSEQMRIEIGPPIEMAARDTLILASDGLLDNLLPDEIVEFVRSGPLDLAVARLVAEARSAWRARTESAPCKPDDLTVIAYRPAELNRKRCRGSLAEAHSDLGLCIQYWPTKKGRGQSHLGVGRGLLISNFRLIATMRSRSKKGEAGLCCAQPCDRPGPIVIMVLPTDIQPEFDLLCAARLADAMRVAYCIGHSSRRLQSKLRRLPGSETIHHNSSSRKTRVTEFLHQLRILCEQTVVPNNRVPKQMRADAVSASNNAVVPRVNCPALLPVTARSCYTFRRSQSEMLLRTSLDRML